MTAPNRYHGYTQEQLDKMCQSKHRWPDEISAMAGAVFALEVFKNTDKLYTYRCPVCRGYHLTKKKIGEKEPVTIPHSYSTGQTVLADSRQFGNQAGVSPAFVTEGL